MADPTTKTFPQLVQGIAAAVQSRASGLVDFTVGAIVRAVSEATAGVVLWLQALILHVLSMTRLSTSEGADADSWVADFGGPFGDGVVASFARLPAAAAVGEVTFLRLSTSGQAVVPVGSQVQTADGTQSFVVDTDITNAAYDPGLTGYVLAPGEATVEVPVYAVTSGALGNVLAGTVTVITSPIPGVDKVSNDEDFVGGANAEGDASMRVRFRGYIQSLREATVAAILFHAMSVQAGLSLIMVENKTLAGQTKRGFVYLVVDDGTGTPPQSLIDAVSENVEAHRAAGVEFAVYAATAKIVNVAMTLTYLPGSSVAQQNAALAAAIAAVRAYLNSLPVGADLPFTRLYQVAFDASPTIVGVPVILANGSNVDITTTLSEVIKAGTVV